MEEDAEASALLAPKREDLVRPDDAVWPAWSGHIREAWSELRDDRHVGAMGGMGRIYFSAIDQYAARFGIAGSYFDSLLIFIRAIDDEYIRHVLEKQEADRNKAKP
jgi:hypothetical protein